MGSCRNSIPYHIPVPLQVPQSLPPLSSHTSNFPPHSPPSPRTLGSLELLGVSEGVICVHRCFPVPSTQLQSAYRSTVPSSQVLRTPACRDAPATGSRASTAPWMSGPCRSNVHTQLTHWHRMTSGGPGCGEGTRGPPWGSVTQEISDWVRVEVTGWPQNPPSLCHIPPSRRS